MNAPTADDIAFAIVMAAQAYNEDPIACAKGQPEMACRRLAQCALEMVFPFYRASTIAKLVGYRGSGWSADITRQPKADRERRLKMQFQIATALRERRGSMIVRLQDVGRMPKRRSASIVGESIVGGLMGDPPPGRSALERRT